MEFSSEMAPEVLTACNDAGLLLNVTRPNAVRIMPPLTVTEAEIDQALALLRDALPKAVAAANG